MAPGNPQRLFAGTEEMGVYASTDGGATWQPAGLEDVGPVRSLAVQDAAGQVVYAGTKRGVFVSKDQGDQWTQHLTGLAGQDVGLLVVDPLQPARVYAVSFQKGDAFLMAIDPQQNQIKAATFFGGSGDESVSGLDFDAQGNVYLLGATSSLVFPLVDPWQSTLSGDQAAFLAKFTPDLAQPPVYSTYLDGDAGIYPGSMVVDADGLVYFTGSSSATDIIPGAQPPKKEPGAESVFVAVVDPAAPTPTPLVVNTVTATVAPTAVAGMSQETGQPPTATPAPQPEKEPTFSTCLNAPGAILLVVGLLWLQKNRRLGKQKA